MNTQHFTDYQRAGNDAEQFATVRDARNAAAECSKFDNYGWQMRAVEVNDFAAVEIYDNAGDWIGYL